MSQTCSFCLQAKASLKVGLHCGICQKLLCKDCAQFLEEGFFSFMKNIPESLVHTVFCHGCFREHVAEAKEQYLDLLARAQEVHIFFKNERNVPIISKTNVKVTVTDCEDRKEALLRLTFQAAQQKYNGLTNTEMISKKVIKNGYQKTYWTGSGFPSKIRED